MSEPRSQDDWNDLGQQVDRQAERMKQAEKDRRSLLAQTSYLGILGLLFVMPVIAGVYLGRWLDSLMSGYSMRWTLSLMFLGLVVGAINVYFLVREQ